MNYQKGLTLTEILLTIIAIGVLASIGIPAYQDYIADTDAKIQLVDQNPILSVPQPVKYMPTVAKPPSGLYAQNLNGQQALAPLEIKTDPGVDYYVKVIDVVSDIEAITIYIRGGDTVEVEVPLSSYIIKYASGTEWYGDKELFGSETSYNKADDFFAFTDNGNQISGYTITLYQVIDGNLQTISIDKNQF